MSVLRTLARRGLPRHPAGARLFSSTTPRADMSRIQIIGRIGTEPEISQTSSGSSMIRYAVATTVGHGDNASTQWHKIVAFGEPFPDRIAKGARVYLEGDLKLSVYDGEDGKKHTGVTIRQRSLSILNKPPSAAGESESA
ncbi:ssDNA-binding protein, mitochondrial [Orbilia ellipsospora]|uniref:SsDNA-binding protein, mitochondrial n=1 Tax=Orbilia ellipsospora TaxID=2528407 RepID=A0AAV9XL39_9PEZI